MMFCFLTKTMETLSSSFLEKHYLSSQPLTLLQFKTPTLKQININSCKASNNKTSFSIETTPPPLHTTSNSDKTTSKTKPSPVVNFFNSLDHLICKFLDPPLPPSLDPQVVLSGNFSPVDELPPTPCHVEVGPLPPCLDGAYIRNGPNPQFAPRGPYHVLDGDGMLHAIKISDGEATFCSRFVRTNKYAVEKAIGSPVVINYLSAHTNLAAALARYAVGLGRVVSGQYDLRRGAGVANTSLAYFGGKLLALWEADLPYEIKVTPDGDVITLGRHGTYGGGWAASMTAHPKVDRGTGEAFAFRCSLGRPFLTYFRINADGSKQPEVPIFSKTEASMVHDFGVTKNYVIFPDSQIVIRPMEIVRGNQLVMVDPRKVPRLGIIPKYAEDERDMWWVEVPGFNIVHAVNAWEEEDGETIVMVGPNVLAVEHVLDRMEMVHLSMERVEINVREKTVKRRPVTTRSLDLAVINPAYVGKKTRYIYAGVVSGKPTMDGVVKLDLSLSTPQSGDCTVASRLYGPGCYGGEPYYVPREPDNPTSEEDDGYLINYVHNETTQESKFVVMDAKSPNLDIVAVVKLPQRVPYGFHGIFVPEYDLQKL